MKDVSTIKPGAGTESIVVQLDVLQAYVPALFGMDLMDRESLTGQNPTTEATDG